MTPSVPLYARPESFRGQRCTRVRLLAPSGGEADGTGAVAACGNLAARPEDCTRELADSVKPRFAGPGERGSRRSGLVPSPACQERLGLVRVGRMTPRMTAAQADACGHDPPVYLSSSGSPGR